MRLAATRHCALCGQVSSLVHVEVIDVWPSGIQGILARAKVRMHSQINWRRLRTMVWRLVVRGVLATIVTAIALIVLPDVTDIVGTL